ncbi:MAG: SH3 domain-containing protein [Desulfobacterales bacterium]|nr:SH3 domain-containing protein [Desulfobacterales bacterium]
MKLKQKLILILVFTFLSTGMPGMQTKVFAGPHAPVFKTAPHGSARIHHGGVSYLFHGGKFYKSGKRGFYRAAPPVGALVVGLPLAAASVVIAGVTYYVYEDVHYKKVDGGYRVVEVPVTTTHAVPPEPVDEGITSGSQVLVTTRELNVRQGPGLGHDILALVRFGNKLTVRGNAPGWIYVVLPDGSYGWVMGDYVTRSSNGPKG